MLLSEKQRTPNRRLPRFGGGQRGFALVIALALMAFLLALILSITTLVRVETAAGDTQLKQLEARQNAILGMMVGLGELQKRTGPDRRSTATAARLDSDPDTVDIDGPAQSRWTGVWSLPEDAASPDGVDPRAAPEHLAWLVSHDPSDATDPFADPSDPVVLASAIDNPDEDALFEFDAVRVPKRTFGEGHSALAYWIEDEGAKAKLNAVAPNYDPDAPPRIPLGNGATAFGQLEGGLNRAADWLPGFPLTFDTAPLLAQNLSSPPSDPDASADELAPHTTLFGHGVVADSLRGGLKLDLSAILEMDADTFEEEIVDPLLPGDRIYEAYLAGESNGQGPRWDLLRQYKTLGENVDTNNIATIRPENTEDLRVTRPGIYPIIERFQLYVVLRLSPDLTPDEPFATYRPRIYLLPAVVIWNPYDRALTATDGLRLVWRTQGQTKGRVFAFNYAAGRYDSDEQWQPFDISNGAATGEFTEFITATGGAQTSLAFRLRGEGGSDGFTLPPGEARLFTLTGNSPGTGTGAGTQMRPGFRGFGLYLDANHTFEVPDSEEDSTKYLDIRTRTKEDLDLDDRYQRIVQFPAFRLHLRTPLPDPEFLQRIENLRWNPEDRAEANSKTVSELSSHTFGDDTNGSRPFALTPRPLPGDNTEIVDSATFPFPSGYEIGLRTPNPSISADDFFRPLGERLLAFNNPRGGINTEPMGKKHEIITRRYYQNILLDNPALGRQANANYRIDTWNNADTATFVGYSDGIGTGGQERFALFHLPNETDRLRSIGELRHLDLVGNNLSLLQNQAVGWRKRSAGPAFVIGEARADPYIPLTEYFSRPDVGNDFNHADHQWLANRQIWDRFFVSTVPPDGSFDFPLPNGRMEPMVRPSQGEAADPDRYRDPRTSAANLWMDGAFNINSVSVPAWKALLSQFVGQPVETENAGTFRDNDASPFPDLPEPFQGPYTGGNSEADTLYTGFRKLDPGEIDTLAREIVRQIKLRGPFTNLADFINRSIAEAADVPDGLTAHAGDGSTLPGSPTMAQLAEDPRLFGLLQAAIESANLNDDLHDGSLDAGDGAYVGQDTEPFRNTNDGLLTLPAGFGPFMEGAPGYMTQGKLLQRLGPVLSARSDTFRIRAYGETTDSITGENVATAYCEAIVQRFPQYVDADADVAETPPDNLSSDANRRFGRQYRVIAFRWLSEDDI